MRCGLITLLLCLMPLLVAAEAIIAVPPLQHRVTDLAGVLSAEDQAALESRLAAIEQNKGSQIAVLIVPTTQPEDIAQYAIRVAEQWKLGRKGVDDGVLVLLAKNDRKMRIEVGYGLEGALPDALAKRIVSDVMRPYLRQGDFYGGLTAGVNAIAGAINGEPLPEPKRHASPSFSLDTLLVVFIAAVALGGVLRAMLGRLLGGLASGGLAAGLLLLFGVGVALSVLAGAAAFLLTLASGQRGVFPGGFGGGGWGGGGYRGGGFSGGGGGFGGGGASGDW